MSYFSFNAFSQYAHVDYEKLRRSYESLEKQHNAEAKKGSAKAAKLQDECNAKKRELENLRASVLQKMGEAITQSEPFIKNMYSFFVVVLVSGYYFILFFQHESVR